MPTKHSLHTPHSQPLRRCGYEVELLEQHDVLGGLATSWKRGPYTFETCLHWLLGSSPGSPMYRARPCGVAWLPARGFAGGDPPHRREPTAIGRASAFGGARAEYCGVLEEPLRLDPHTQLKQLSYCCFHFDPTFAAPGKTALTCFLPTYACDYWMQLREGEPERYRAEKARFAGLALDVLERTHPGLRQSIEVTGVSTAATVVRLTGNWRGSMEGWLPTLQTGLAGQWVMPGGGLPGGLMSARAAIRDLCAHDGVHFANCVERWNH